MFLTRTCISDRKFRATFCFHLMLKGGKIERERFSLGLMKITIPFLNWKYVKIMATRCSVCDTQRIDSKEIVLLRCYHASSFLLVRLAQKSTLSSLHTSVQSFNYRTFARSGIHTCTFRSKRQRKYGVQSVG